MHRERERPPTRQKWGGGIEGTRRLSETCRNKSRLPLHLSRAAPKSTLAVLVMGLVSLFTSSILKLARSQCVEEYFKGRRQWDKPQSREMTIRILRHFEGRRKRGYVVYVVPDPSRRSFSGKSRA